MLNNASAATVQAPPYTSERQRTLATLVVSIALVLEIIDVSIINVAIPVVQRDLLASPRQIEWVVTGYLFFFSILLLTGGRLGDLYGYRRMFISGLLAFGAASAGCGLATSPEMLVAMRIVQGASGAMMGPQILSLMQVLYRPHERFRVMSIFGLLGGAAGILGPVLGGIIIESNLFGLSWRPIFLINVPVIAIAVALAWRVLPAVRSPEAKGIDPLGTLLAVVGGGALLLTLIEGPALRWPAWMVLPPLLSVITVSLLWRHLLGRERRGGTLLLPPAVLRDRFFRAGIIITLLYQLTTASLLLATALVLQSGLGFSPFHTALMHIPFALGAMFSIAVAGRRLSLRLGRNAGWGGGTDERPTADGLRDRRRAGDAAADRAGSWVRPVRLWDGAYLRPAAGLCYGGDTGGPRRRGVGIISHRPAVWRRPRHGDPRRILSGAKRLRTGGLARGLYHPADPWRPDPAGDCRPQPPAARLSASPGG